MLEGRSSICKTNAQYETNNYYCPFYHNILLLCIVLILIMIPEDTGEPCITLHSNIMKYLSDLPPIFSISSIVLEGGSSIYKSNGQYETNNYYHQFHHHILLLLLFLVMILVVIPEYI